MVSLNAFPVFAFRPTEGSSILMVMKYFIRACKYLLYFFILFVIMVGIIYLLSPEKSQGVSVTQLFKAGSLPKLLIFFACISAIYPKFAFIQRKLYINGTFEENRECITEAFLNMGYELESEGPQAISFRLKQTSMKISRMWEDRVTVNISDNPLIIDGYRRDVDRIARHISFLIAQRENSEEVSNEVEEAE